MRLADGVPVPVACRGQFLGLIARTMRRVLVDHARRRATAKRGGDVTYVTLDEALDGVPGRQADVLVPTRRRAVFGFGGRIRPTPARWP